MKKGPLSKVTEEVNDLARSVADTADSCFLMDQVSKVKGESDMLSAYMAKIQVAADSIGEALSAPEG